MVFKKRLDDGFNGFLVPTIPKCPRSVRKRVPHRKNVEDGQICAFELLASLAGKLLQESESSVSSNASEGNEEPVIGKDDVKQEQPHIDNKPDKTECIDQGSYQNGVFFSDLSSEKIGNQCNFKEIPQSDNDALLERTLVIENCKYIDKARDDTKSSMCNNAVGKHSTKIEAGSLNFGESTAVNMDSVSVKQQGVINMETGNSNVVDTSETKHRNKLCVKSPAVTSSGSKIKLSPLRDTIRIASFSRHRNNVKLASRDDDENFSRCNKPSTKLNYFRPLSRVGDRRIRKLLNFKYWKVAPKLRDYEIRPDGGIKPFYRKRKTCYNRYRCRHDILIKRRRYFDQSSAVTSDGGMSSDSVSNSPEKNVKNVDKSNLAATFDRANGASSIADKQASFCSKDSHVKFSITTFKIPELFIEVSGNATLGSLKKKATEALSTLLGGGFCVGIHLQGNKVRDDSRTLLQTGISCKDNKDTIGFSLEPNPLQASSPLCLANPPPLPCDRSLLNRLPEPPLFSSGVSEALPGTPLINSENLGESNQERSSSHTDVLTEKPSPDCKALVAVSETNMTPLAIVPVNQKSKHCEHVQRRIRRPFYVSEVEALVQAIEELGTGRWRDVKLRAFENADHRTYVDLKDKWKTLVHTARISPQQRRGELVPQELLDRVLAAHSYWSQHQAKQHGKHQPGALKLIEGQI